MFRNKNKNETSTAKNLPFYKKRGWKIFFVIFGVFIVVLGSYIGYLYASGKRIFDPNNYTKSPFFSNESTKQLRGEGDGRINILLLGMGGANHPGGQLTDTIMVASINPVDKSLALLSIPRDLYVPVAGKKYSAKINEVYNIGEKEKAGSGANLAKETVGKILDLPIHYYVTADFYGFKKLVDTIGGVDVTVDKNLNDPYFPDENMVGYEPFYIKAGQHHMDGTTALKFARSRETTSDFDRAARQQKIISAIKQKVLSAGYLANPKKVADLVNIVGGNIKTDFTLEELYSLSKIVTNLDTSKTVTKVLTNGTDGELYDDSSSGTYRLLPKDKTWEQIQKIAHELFTDPDLKREDARIEVLNGSSTVGQAKKVADTLSSYGYKIVQIDNTKEKYPTTQIYDYSNGKKDVTIQFLQKRLGAQAVKKTDSSKSNIDITIIIGDNYKGFSKTP